MTKMLWELNLPLAIAKAKEDMGVNTIYKYLRYYRMFIERFKWSYKGEDLTKRIENLLFWRGQVAFVKDVVYGLVVCEIVDSKSKVNPNGQLVSVSVEGENGYKKNNLEVGKDVVILYSDQTKLPPVLYIWAIANEIITREDIINQQDNMLRKPILLYGEGEELDNVMAKALNVLSGVAYINLKPKSKGKSNILLDKPAEVLNLEVGNAYKGAELWDSRKRFEELICDYLGYTTVKNEKRERMNTSEVNNDNSIGDTFYESSTSIREDSVNKVKDVLTEELEFEKILKGKEDIKDDNQENMESNNRKSKPVDNKK